MKFKQFLFLLIICCIISSGWAKQAVLQDGTKYNGIEYRGCEDTYVRCVLINKKCVSPSDATCIAKPEDITGTTEFDAFTGASEKKYINDNYCDSTSLYSSHDYY